MNAPTKLCKICGQRPVRIENRKGRKYQKTDCNNCHNKNARKRNPQTYYRINKKTKHKCKERNKQWLKTFLQDKNCTECGESDKAVLEFHHLDPATKSFCIANGISHYSLTRLQQEVAKCGVICSNCHLRKHATNSKGRNWIKKQKVLDSIGIHHCDHCLNSDIRVLVFHHVKPANKIFSISKGWSTLDIDALVTEARKCQVLCQNCHRKLHQQTE